MIQKRGLSPVIAVVLLLMITLIAVSIVISFLMPFIRGLLEESSECFEVREDLSFGGTPYNCFNGTLTGGVTGFSVRVDNENIVGFRVSLQSQGTSDAIDIANGATNPNVKMLLGGGGFGSDLELPRKGGVRTYVLNSIADKAEILPLLESGKECELSDKIIISECNDPQVIADLYAP